jgi:hypothetical protein
VAPSGWIYQNQLAFFGLIDRFSLAAVDVSGRRVYPEVLAGADSAMQRMHGPFTILPKLLFPATASVAQPFAQAQTQLDMAVVACGLERYRLAHGNYPEALAALSPRFLETIPHDLFTGQPFKYEHTEDGQYVLSSVGWKPQEAGSSQSNMDRFGRPTATDWSWRLPSK